MGHRPAWKGQSWKQPGGWGPAHEHRRPLPACQGPPDPSRQCYLLVSPADSAERPLGSPAPTPNPTPLQLGWGPSPPTGWWQP